jgi:transglutaminase-like putative cysteine protease
MVAKMFSVQRERDHVYLAVISFLMILSAAILTVDSFFLAAFCVFLLLTVSTFISMEMRRSMADAARRAHGPAEGDLPGMVGTLSGVSGGWPARLAKSLSGTSALLVTGTVLGAGVIFFVLPRLSTGYLTNLSARNTYVAGFSDEVKLGAIGQIQQSDSVVMHVKFADRTPIPADVKWRGVTLSQFDGKRWFNERSLMKANVVHVLGGRLLFVPGPFTKPLNGAKSSVFTKRLEYHVVMQPIGLNAFFLIPRPQALQTDVRDFSVDGAGTIGLNDPTRQISYYDAQSVIMEPTLEARQSNSREFPEQVATIYTQLPEGIDPRIAGLARQVSGGATSVYAKASAIEGFLQSGGQYSYTLELLGPADQRGDPLAHFLFDTKRGHCEYFASAMAIMLRTQGIPARIANGFRGGEFNDISGSYIVRARDAHSWVEAYIPGFGWESFDPTPPANAGPKSGWQRLLLYVDAMREFWSEWVINYDHAHQNTLGEATVTRSRETYELYKMWTMRQYRGFLEKLRNSQKFAARDPLKLALMLALVLAVLMLAMRARRIIGYIRELRISRNPAKSPSNAASIWYQKMTRLMARRGIAKDPAQTPEEFLRTIDEAEIRASVATFTKHYERARFGESAEDAGKLPGLYEDVEAQLKR